jgi:type I restriction enzyme S subunit
VSWETAKIGEIASVVTKGTTPTTYGMPFTDNGVNFIKAEALNGDCTLDRSGFTFVSESTHEKLRRSILDEGDVLLTIAGAQVGRCGIVRPEHLPANTNQAVGIIRIDRKKASARFVYYFFKHPKTFRMCQGLGGQAAQPNINLTVLKGFGIPLPTLGVQEAIVEILSAYDDLIENNQRRIALLEEAARSLYREWFVHFRFPGHDDGHQRVKTPIGDIPKGWEVTKLGAVTTKIGSGATPRGGEQSYKAEGVALIRSLNIYDYRFEFDNLAFIDEQQASELDNVTVEEDDVLLNITGASVARCALVPSYLLPARVNQHVAIVRADPAKASPFYILDSINSESRKAQLFALARAGGATREALTKSTLSNFEIILPPRLLLSSYDEIAQGIHKQREVLLRQIQSLRRARDLLLPRLMNGEIAV